MEAQKAFHCISVFCHGIAFAQSRAMAESQIELSGRGLDVVVAGDAVSLLINRPRLELEPPGHIYSANVIVPVTL